MIIEISYVKGIKRSEGVLMSAKFDFDVLYIGAGHGTFDGAAPLAQTGVSVGVIESGLAQIEVVTLR